MSYLDGSPNGVLYVGNVKWSNDYKHVIPFVDRAARNTFLESHLNQIKNNVIYINPNRYVDIKGDINDVETLNYMYYKNDSDISNTRYCCFITDYEYIAPKTTRLYIELDVFQMYFYTATFYKSYIERGIVKPSTNTENKNYLPEPINAPLEFEQQLKQILDDDDWQPIWVLHSASYYNSTTGEYEYKGKGTHNTYGEYGRFIESQTEIEQVLKMYGRKGFNDTLQDFSDLLDDTVGSLTQQGKDVIKALIQGIFSGGVATTQGWNNMTGLSTVKDVFSIADYQDHRDELIGLYAIPKWLKDTYTTGGGDANFADNERIATSQISLPLNNSTLANGYTPRNKKLLTSVCRGYILANRTGLRIPFKPELFTGAATITLNGITMSTGGYQYNIGNYADKQQSFGEVAYNSERRVGYDANTGINKALNILTAAGQTAATLGGIAGGMATANGVIASASSGLVGLTSAIDKIGQQEAHFGSNGDLLRITGTRPALRWFEVNPSYSECEAIDDFFDMYGYTIQQHKNPLSFIYELVNGQYDRTQPTRPKWNYVKTQNVNLRCNAPAVYENQLKAIFNAGITLWHSYADFGDYSQDNINFN